MQNDQKTSVARELQNPKAHRTWRKTKPGLKKPLNKGPGLLNRMQNPDLQQKTAEVNNVR